MTMGERIKKCRKKLNMSQEELAKKMGYVARSSITRIEKGQNDIPCSKIVEFAKALETTPEYLMGLKENNFATEDVQLVVHAKWVFVSQFHDEEIYRCSKCHGLTCEEFPYCPSCGAKMDKEVKS